MPLGEVVDMFCPSSRMYENVKVCAGKGAEYRKVGIVSVFLVDLLIFDD